MDASGFLLHLLRLLAWAIFLGLWIAVSRVDLREKRIPHRHLAMGLGFTALAYVLMLAATMAGRHGGAGSFYRWEYYRDLLVYLAASGAVGVGMWRAGVWPAGDAKLFLFLSCLYPMMSVPASFFSGWLFMMVLINIFVPAAAAVFAQAARWVWLSRLRHQKDFLLAAGPRRHLDFMALQVRERLARSRGELGAWAKGLRADPREALGGLFRWVSLLVVMSAVSCTLQRSVASPAARAALAFGLMLAMSRGGSSLPRLAAPALAAGLLALAWAGVGPVAWADLWRSFGAMGLFGMFLYGGVQWTLGLAGGQLFLLAVPLLGLVGGLLPGAGFFARFWPLAVLGAFFGLSLALVRIWDGEDHPDIPREKVLPYMVLHHSFVSRLEADREFFEERIGSLYPDGLTREQTEALKDWCRANSIETVPLAVTMAFSHWIFLGFFITWVLRGHVLAALYR